MKMDEVMQSIKAEARSRVGDAPSISARVASAKHQQTGDPVRGVELPCHLEDASHFGVVHSGGCPAAIDQVVEQRE